MSQVNKQNGDNSMAIYVGKSPPHGLIDPDQHPITPNQEIEAAIIRYALKVPGARNRLLAIVARYQARGFMTKAGANEFMTRSHGPIWDRAFAVWLWSANQQGDAEMVDIALRIWGWYVYISDLVRVPSGPLAGRRVTVNGRYAPWSGTSDCCQQQIKSERVLEPHIIANGAFYQDDFGALVVHDLVRAGRFFVNLHPSLPPMPCDYSIEKHELGHVTRVPKGALEPGDPSIVWVVYGSGQIGDDRQGGGVPDLGELTAEIVALKAVAGAGHGVEAP